MKYKKFFLILSTFTVIGSSIGVSGEYSSIDRKSSDEELTKTVADTVIGSSIDVSEECSGIDRGLSDEELTKRVADGLKRRDSVRDLRSLGSSQNISSPGQATRILKNKHSKCLAVAEAYAKKVIGLLRAHGSISQETNIDILNSIFSDMEDSHFLVRALLGNSFNENFLLLGICENSEDVPIIVRIKKLSEFIDKIESGFADMGFNIREIVSEKKSSK